MFLRENEFEESTKERNKKNNKKEQSKRENFGKKHYGGGSIRRERDKLREEDDYEDIEYYGR